tara:strand:- start:175 stop:600 length:426 start_codon:yes stop_codon:yes gene_type:complete
LILLTQNKNKKKGKTMDMYKEGIKRKLRFPTNRGLVNIEDLNDMSLKQLDASAKIVNKALKTSEEESFISEVSKESESARLTLDILKDVIADKLAEKAEAAGRVAKKAEKEKYTAALARKQDEGINSMTEAELKAKLAELS